MHHNTGIARFRKEKGVTALATQPGIGLMVTKGQVFRRTVNPCRMIKRDWDTVNPN